MAFGINLILKGIGSSRTQTDNEIKKEIARFVLDLSFFIVYNATRYNKKSNTLNADVAELADAHGSGPCEVTLMQVQVLSSAFFMPIFSLTSMELYTKMTGLFKFSPHT